MRRVVCVLVLILAALGLHAQAPTPTGPAAPNPDFKLYAFVPRPGLTTADLARLLPLLIFSNRGAPAPDPNPSPLPRCPAGSITLYLTDRARDALGPRLTIHLLRCHG